ncbi:MAG: hypothetical protein AAF488_13390, partial [Planctomycetota bacterium]
RYGVLPNWNPGPLATNGLDMSDPLYSEFADELEHVFVVGEFAVERVAHVESVRREWPRIPVW